MPVNKDTTYPVFILKMTSMDYSVSTSNVLQDCVPIEDEFVIEELPDPEAPSDDCHDQLPSVEEYKAAYMIHPTGTTTTRVLLLLLTLVSAVALLISSTAVASENKTHEPYTVSGRTKQVEEFLFTNNISSLPQLQEIGSAQHRAAAFVADGDSMQVQLTPDNARRFVERYVLALLYYQFNGPRWTYNLKFLSGLDHCEWHDDFETSNGKIVHQGVICNDDGHVVELNLGMLEQVGSPYSLVIICMNQCSNSSSFFKLGII